MGGSRRFGIACVLAAIVCASQTAAQATARTNAPARPPSHLQAPHAVPGHALVRFVPGTAPTIARATLERAGATVLGRIGGIGYDVVRVPSEAAIEALRADPRVAIAEPNYTGRIATSDDCLDQPCTGTPGQWQWAMNNRAFAARAFRPSPGARVTVAVLDTHIDATHPDLRDQIDATNARDWVPSSRWTGAAAYHGTFVAGLAAAADNDVDMAGMSPAVRVLPLTVVDGGGTTDAATLAQAILYARDKGARIVNLSLGIAGDSNAVHDAIRAVRGDTLVVAAAGNNTGSAAFYPGSYPEVMSVSGTDANDERASCSNYNSNVSVSAPADRLIGDAPMPAERTQAPCGTSAAAPQVSALGALLLLQDPTRTPAQVRAIIERSADDLGAPGRDDSFGAGRINAERALNEDGTRVVAATATVASMNGSSTVGARAAGTVARAELVYDRPGSAPVPMAIDGSNLSATIPAGAAAGPHPAWIRVFDGRVWSAAAVAVVAVDGRAPTLAGAQVSNGAPALNQPVTLTFTATDDYAETISYGVEFRSGVTGEIVYRGARYDVPAGAQRFDWLPPATATPGRYTVKFAVSDGHGNIAQSELGTVVA